MILTMIMSSSLHADREQGWWMSKPRLMLWRRIHQRLFRKTAILLLNWKISQALPKRLSWRLPTAPNISWRIKWLAMKIPMRFILRLPIRIQACSMTRKLLMRQSSRIPILWYRLENPCRYRSRFHCLRLLISNSLLKGSWTSREMMARVSTCHIWASLVIGMTGRSWIVWMVWLTIQLVAIMGLFRCSPIRKPAVNITAA